VVARGHLEVRVVGHVAAGQSAGDGGVVPVIEHAVLAEQRIEDGGAVAGGVDAADAGAAVLVGQDRPSGRDGRAVQQVAVGHGAHRRDGKVALHRCSVRQLDALDSPVPFQPPRRRKRADANAAFLQVGGDEPSGRLAGEFVPWVCMRSQQVDREAPLRKSGGSFDAEHAPADDGDFSAA